MAGYFHTIVEGDSLLKLAAKHNLPSWETIWNDEHNEALRDAHADDSPLLIGEQVWIPAPFIPPPIRSGFFSRLFAPAVRIQSVSFSSDHTGLVRNDDDWKKTGAAVTRPTWDRTHSDPVIHSAGQTAALEAVLQVKGISGRNGTVTSTGDAQHLTYEGQARLSSGEVRVQMQGKAAIPHAVEYLQNARQTWEITTPKGRLTAGVTLHDFFHILGPPIAGALPEDGLTTMRLETAINWVKSCNTLEPVEIVERLFEYYPAYVLGFAHLPDDQQQELDADPALKAALMKAGFAAYRKDDVGGAWPLAPFHKYGGECQAIVRLIRGFLHQVGCPGQIELKYVNARVDAGYNVTVQIGDVGRRCSGPNPNRRYTLADREVEVNHLYGSADVGWNNYEAYMKYTYTNAAGRQMNAWFGGGTGKIGEVDSGDAAAVRAFEDSLIRVFWAMAEYKFVNVNGTPKRRLTWVHRFQPLA